jgi:alkanesulfonate monooxygenase SsuD/methylene tetrahydromethanopterin reductase-like flavin-dependent oxidoreductase (luciferase family)
MSSIDAAVDKYQQPILGSENRLKLAIFGINLRGGVTMAEVEGGVQATWQENLRYARWADRLGLDGIVPVARWRGYGGRSNLGERSFETFTWATGLLAATTRIQVFATFHVPLAHPVLAAKMVATADHVSGGRFGLNIVAGWYAQELSMFGLTQREHDARYAVADEWTQVLKQLWTVDGERDFDGAYFQVPGGFSEPKPLQKPYPAIMNAGTSLAGRGFAARHSDLIFAGLQSLDAAPRQIAEIKQLAREQHGREIRVFGRGHVVCRDTEAEARDHYDLVHRRLADVEGARNVTRMSMANSQSTDWESAELRAIIEGMTAGFWAVPMVGTPDQVVQAMLDLERAGLDGIGLSFVDYDDGLRRLEDDILPRLVQAGARTPVLQPHSDGGGSSRFGAGGGVGRSSQLR